MEVQAQDGTFVIDIQCEAGDVGSITRRSAFVARGLAEEQGLRMCAADGTEITNLGRKIIRFKGNDALKPQAVASDSIRRL